MRQEIEGVVYDTASAALIGSHEVDSTHVRRVTALYRSEQGRYFIVEEHETHGLDGALLLPFTDAMAREWLLAHGKAAAAPGLFEGVPVSVTVDLDGALVARLDHAAQAAGLSRQDWLSAAIAKALG